ncbi:type II toxin-antitoxin system VapC family toxin [Xanthobacter autotrophicus]|uniref:type II toxin-antitoxin system VapC family toxin n=1 Tax=Xanthobacter autotrophicus TaxID=280 RepID=UPI00372BF6CC
MNGTTSAEPGFRIYWDTNVFIAAFEGRGPASELLVSLLLSGWDAGVPPLVTSELTHSELLVKPYELGRLDLVQIYDNWTLSNRHIEVVPVFRGVLHDAAILRSRDKALKLPDAIHVATAVGMKCTVFLSDDQRIKSQPDLQRMAPSEENVRWLLEKVSSDGR